MDTQICRYRDPSTTTPWFRPDAPSRHQKGILYRSRTCCITRLTRKGRRRHNQIHRHLAARAALKSPWSFQSGTNHHWVSDSHKITRQTIFQSSIDRVGVKSAWTAQGRIKGRRFTLLEGWSFRGSSGNVLFNYIMTNSGLRMAFQVPEKIPSLWYWREAQDSAMLSCFYDKILSTELKKAECSSW